MRLVLHLLRKDIRQWWYEIVVTLIVLFTAAFTAAEPINGSITLVVSFLFPYLSPLLLILLVGRVIQAERWPSPLEDWRTRPISRLHIFSAKSLFAGLFVVLPCWLGHLIVFRSLGYSTSIWLQESPLLLFSTLVLFVLPAAAVMAVTTHVGQAILTAVGLLLGSLLVSANLSSHDFSAAPPNWRVTAMLLALFSVVALAALYCQLLRNRTWMARGVLVSGCMVVVCLASWRPFRDSTVLRDWLNPMPDTLRPMALKVSVPKSGLLSTAPGSRADIVMLQFPAELSGVPDDVVTEASTGNAVFHAADGSEYRFGLTRGDPSVATRWSHALMMPRKRYDVLRVQPVELDLQFWVYVYLNPESYTATVKDRRLPVGDLFECSPNSPLRTASEMPDLECSTANSNLRRLEFSWPTKTGTVKLPVKLPATAYGDDSYDFFRSSGGRVLRREVFSGNLLPYWEEGTQVQVRHYKAVYQWHKTVHLSGVHLDDYSQTE